MVQVIRTLDPTTFATYSIAICCKEMRLWIEASESGYARIPWPRIEIDGRKKRVYLSSGEDEYERPFRFCPWCGKRLKLDRITPV